MAIPLLIPVAIVGATGVSAWFAGRSSAKTGDVTYDTSQTIISNQTSFQTSVFNFESGSQVEGFNYNQSVQQAQRIEPEQSVSGATTGAVTSSNVNMALLVAGAVGLAFLVVRKK